MWGTVGIKGSVLEKMKAVKEAGFEGVEMMSHMDQDEVLRARDEVGLGDPQRLRDATLGQTASHPDPRCARRGWTALKQTLRDAKRYGASSILLVPAVVNKEVTYKDAYTRSQAEIRKAIPLAEELGVKIASKTSGISSCSVRSRPRSMWTSLTARLWVAFRCRQRSQLRLARAMDSDPGQTHPEASHQGIQPQKRDEEGLWKGFDVPFLEGDNDWPAVMKALDDIGYHGWAHDGAAGGDTPDGLRDLVRRFDKILAC